MIHPNDFIYDVYGDLPSFLNVSRGVIHFKYLCIFYLVRASVKLYDAHQHRTTFFTGTLLVLNPAWYKPGSKDLLSYSISNALFQLGIFPANDVCL